MKKGQASVLLAAATAFFNGMPELVSASTPSSKYEFSDAEKAELQGLSGKEKKARIVELKAKYSKLRSMEGA